MDWNMKPPSSWDFTELEQEQFSGLDAVNHGFGDHKPVREDFSVDLKLGHMGNPGSETADSWKDLSRLAKPVSSPSGVSKRSRGSYGSSQAASCLVDGCNADLSGCRDYHRRHKVCELHSKTPQVTIAGHKQRFCQQCSRFHSLEEFDEGKRSCRKRLDGHNRRRRKPQPEPFSRYGSVLSNYTGTQLLPFSSSLVYPSTSVMSPTWVGTSVKPDADSGQLSFYKQNTLLASSSSSSSGDRPIPTPGSHNHPLPPPEPSDRDRRAIYSGAPTQVQSSDCALSLLSSPGLGHQGAPMQLGSVLPHPGAFHHFGSGEESHQSLPSQWS